MIRWHDLYRLVFLFLWSISICRCINKGCIPIDQCSCRLTDTKQIITLWEIDNPNDIHFKDQKVNNSDSYIDYNPCTFFDRGAGCVEEIVCEHDEVDSEYLSAGRKGQHEATRKVDDVTFKYTGVKQDGVERKTEIALICDLNALEPKMGIPNESKSKDSKSISYKFSITSKCACPNECRLPDAEKNLSIGSILCILLFVLIVVCLVCGGLFLKYHKAEEGTAVIPNSEFWKDMPTKVKEGVRFTKSYVVDKKRGTYGQI